MKFHSLLTISLLFFGNWDRRGLRAFGTLLVGRWPYFYGVTYNNSNEITQSGKMVRKKFGQTGDYTIVIIIAGRPSII